MAGVPSVELARDLLGSARMFSSFLFTVCEEQPLQAVPKRDLTVSQARILQYVNASPGLTIHELAALLRVSVSAAGQAVERLVQRKLVVRRPKLRDRRSATLWLTQSGRRLFDQYRSAQEASIKDVVREFTPNELRRATELLDRLALALNHRISAVGEVCLECGAYFRERCIIRGLGRRNCLHTQSLARRSH